MKQNTRG